MRFLPDITRQTLNLYEYPENKKGQKSFRFGGKKEEKYFPNRNITNLNEIKERRVSVLLTCSYNYTGSSLLSDVFSVKRRSEKNKKIFISRPRSAEEGRKRKINKCSTGEKQKRQGNCVVCATKNKQAERKNSLVRPRKKPEGKCRLITI